MLPTRPVSRLIASLLATLTLTLPLHAQAADEVPSSKSRRAQAAAQEELIGRTVFHVLVGELALQRGNIDTGLAAYIDIARRTQDPRLFARATEVASFARKYDVALELSRQWLALEPESQQARQMQSSLLLLLNRLDDLAPQVTSLLEQDKDNLANNLLGLNRLFAQHQDKQSVYRLIERVTAPYLTLPEAHYARAVASLAANMPAQAQSEIRQASQLRPNWEPAAILQAQLTSRQSPQEAILQLNRFVEQNPQANDARLILARLLISEQAYEPARQHLEKLQASLPNHPDVLYPLSMLALQRGDLQASKAGLEKLQSTEFADKNALHFFLGQIEEEQRRPEQALTHYQQITDGERLIVARVRAAQILQSQGRIDEAQRLIHNTAGRTPEERTQIILAESQILRDSKQFPAALSLLETALKRQPDNIDLRYDAALICEKLGKFDLLEQHLRHLLTLKPDHPHALNALAYSWAERNIRLNEAEKLIQQALAIAPEDPFITDSLGWVFFRQGKNEQALQTLTQAYRLKADPEIAAHLSEVLWSLNRREEASRLLNEVAQRFPDNEVIRDTRQRLLR